MFDRLFYALSKIFTDKTPETPGLEDVKLMRTVHAPDGKHRVCFFKREEDGVCGYREEFYDTSSMEAFWRPVSSGYAKQYDSMEEAEAAAKAEVPWVRLVMP